MLEAIARKILQDQKTVLPDISHVIVLFSNPLAIKPFKEKLFLELTSMEHEALLGPDITTLERWLKSFHVAEGKKNISAEHRFLMLAKVLKQYPSLYGEGDPWHLAEELLGLFDQLSDSKITLPDNESAFFDYLSSAYGGISNNHTALLKEARLVYILWRAWHEQLDALGFCDASTLTAKGLASSLQSTVLSGRFIYMSGFTDFSPALTSWIDCLHQRGQISVLTQPCKGFLYAYNIKSNPPAHGLFYNACFDYQAEPLGIRAQALRARIPESPIADRVFTLPVSNAEQQAKAVVMATKQALLKKQKSIAIITEDRRLGRRVRALLERESIILNDSAGWALSTTSASTVIENWLRCLEENFPYHAFLDFLKSPFLQLIESHEDQLALVYRLEQDIILHENIAGGIDRYHNALRRRASRLDMWDPAKTESLFYLLNKLSDIAKDFSPFFQNKPFPATNLISTFRQSLNTLGIMQHLKEDQAGQLITETLVNMQTAASADPSTMLSWLDFRIWLGRLLESCFFIPKTLVYDVELLNFRQSHLLSFDTVILAAADARHLPGETHHTSFFNDSVRASLGLQTWETILDSRATQFRALLEHSGQLKIIWQAEENNEPLMASPWITAIERFHEAAYGEILRDTELNFALEQAEFHAYANHNLNLKIPTKPAPACIPDLLPSEITVSAYQRLMNCPYQFYASDLLKLKPGDEIREVLQKADYGSRVHLCLQAFHSPVKHLTGPFTQPLMPENRHAACTMLEKISEQVFSQDMEDNFQHRSWYKRWLSMIPSYIDWEIQRQSNWHFMHAEKPADITLNAIKLYGRIDRVDQFNQSFALIDYKTGAVSNPEEVLQGEDIQLSSYALMLEGTQRIEYVGLGKHGGIDNRMAIEGEALSKLHQALHTRTLLVMQMLTDGHDLPAWADEESCARCAYAGLCRRHTWQT